MKKILPIILLLKRPLLEPKMFTVQWSALPIIFLGTENRVVHGLAVIIGAQRSKSILTSLECVCLIIVTFFVSKVCIHKYLCTKNIKVIEIFEGQMRLCVRCFHKKRNPEKSQ